VRPMKDGVIADFDITEKMLRYFLALIIENHVFKVKPRVIVCVPWASPKWRSARCATLRSWPGAKKYSWLRSRWLRRSARTTRSDSDGNMVIDIGGGTTEIGSSRCPES